MNHFRLLPAILLLACTWAISACKKEELPAQKPLLTNGDIEQKIQGWSFGYDTPHPTNPNGYAFGFTSEAASSPQYSLKINCNQVRNDSAFSYYVQNSISMSTIPVGAKLTLKAKIKTALVGQGVSIAIRGDKGNAYGVFFVTTQGKTPITGTQEFTEYSVVLPSYPGGIDNLLVYLVYLPKTTGSVYFDDLSLTVN
ncbi:hypothetical protein [Spirosoma pulveris]